MVDMLDMLDMLDVDEIVTGDIIGNYYSICDLLDSAGLGGQGGHVRHGGRG